MLIDKTASLIQSDFKNRKMLLSFTEYLKLLAKHPEIHTRDSARYLVDMMDHFGKTPVDPTTFRFHLFDLPIDGIAPKVVGHERVQTELYQTLKSFIRQGQTNKLILLHGPNGSAKSTLIHSLMTGLERYSQKDEGAVYSFQWIFPAEKIVKKGMGFQSNSESRAGLESYADLPEEDIAARIPSELRDHPLLLIPAHHREQCLCDLMGEDLGRKTFRILPPHLRQGDLGPRSKMIFEALLSSYNGDFSRVLMHVQIERFFFSRRYRKGLTTIEPQLHVDAHYNQLTYNKSISALPVALHNLNLFDLSGDLIEANRGMVEYSDLLKRPLDSFKYLLVICEKGAINVGPSIAHLDMTLLGSSNELQLDAFKEFPDFSSFKARMELIRVPYLLSVSQESELYSLLLKDMATDKHVAPHVAWTLAMWAVLTRLKKPNSINYPPHLSNMIASLTPLQKARIYDQGELPHSLTPEERKLLKSNLQKIKEEYVNIPYYEGRMGASAREIKNIMIDALQNPEFKCLSPLSVLKEMQDFVKRISEYEFLKQDVKDGYHDAAGFIQTVRDEYLNVVDREVRQSMGLYDAKQWEGFMRKYITHISALLRKEKVRNPTSGQSEDPDLSLIGEFETIVVAPKEKNDRDLFRQNIIAQVGAWSLDHPNQTVDYAVIFPEYWTRLEKHYYQSQKGTLAKMHNALSVYGTDAFDPYSDGSRLAKQTVENMRDKLGYCDHCAREVITFFIKARHLEKE